MSEKIKSIENSINDRLPDQLVGIVQCRPIYGAYCFARKWVFDFLSRKIDFLTLFIRKVDFQRSFHCFLQEQWWVAPIWFLYHDIGEICKVQTCGIRSSKSRLFFHMDMDIVPYAKILDISLMSVRFDFVYYDTKVRLGLWITVLEKFNFPINKSNF